MRLNKIDLGDSTLAVAFVCIFTLGACLVGCDAIKGRDQLDGAVPLDGLPPCPEGQVRLADGTCGEPCEGNSIRSTDGQCHPCTGEHEVARNNLCVCDVGYVKAGGVCVALDFVLSDRLGTRWHPDPDGDGITSEVDLCPDIYDPIQGDADGDRMGDLCDPDYAAPVENGPITDLHAEHVTPYGAWLNYRSPKSSEYGLEMVVAWSTDAEELRSLSGFSQAVARGDSRLMRFNVDYGHKLPIPIMLTNLEPSTRYYVAVTEELYEGLADPPSNVVEFTTAAEPPITLGSTYPRVWANPALIEALKARHSGGDQAFSAYRDTIGERALSAASFPGSTYEPEKHCAAASLLYLITGEASYQEAGQTLFEIALEIWEGSTLDENQYRWADAVLGICTDLQWNELSPQERERAVEAFVEDDENIIAELNLIDDTDAYASNARTWLIDGLVGCEAPGISAGTSARACAVLEVGKRAWFGVQLVKARRNAGRFAQSGGALPDGSFYGPGTSSYWMQSFWALSNAGISPATYSQFIENNFLSHFVYPLTPSGLGYTTWGDVEGFEGHFDIEPNSFPIRSGTSRLMAMHLGLLDTAGRATSASWARWLLQEQFGDERDEAAAAGLLFVTDEIQPKDYKDELPLSYLTSGFGLFFDRLSWLVDSSMLFFRAGWTGVDHSHGDQGHLQFYRRGRWITHEAVGYSGPASSGWGHNVLLLQRKLDEGDETGQFYMPGVVQSDQKVLRASAQSGHTLAIADITGSYLSDENDSDYYQAVQRSVLWLKGDGAGPDNLWIYDLVDPGPSAPGNYERRWVMHFDEAPVTSGNRASLELSASPADQAVEVHFVHPAGVGLSVVPGDGSPGDFPGRLYLPHLVADPQLDGSKLRMLTLLRVSDAGTAAADPQGISSAEFIGALSGGDLVLFSKTAASGIVDGVPQGTVEVDAAGDLRAWITGLIPSAKYDVTATRQGEKLTLTVKVGQALPADAGGMVAVNIAAGGEVSPIYPPQ